MSEGNLEHGIAKRSFEFLNKKNKVDGEMILFCNKKNEGLNQIESQDDEGKTWLYTNSFHNIPVTGKLNIQDKEYVFKSNNETLGSYMVSRGN